MSRILAAVSVVALAACMQPVSESGTDEGASASGTATGAGSGSSSGNDGGGSSGRSSSDSSGSGSSGFTGSTGGSSGSSGFTGLIGKVTRIAGNGDVHANGEACSFSCYVDGRGDQAMFQQVSGLAVLGRTLYVADTLNEVVRAIDLSSAPEYNVTTLAGNPSIVKTQDGVGTNAGFFLPRQPFAYQGTLLVGTGMNVRQITVPGGVVTTLAGPDSGNMASENSSFPVAFSEALFNDVAGLAVDASSGLIYTVDEGSGYVHELNPFTEEVYFPAGANKLATFSDPTSAVALDGVLFISNTLWNQIDLITLGNPTTVQVVAGAGGGQGFSDDNGPYANVFNAPQGLCTDGTSIYIVDSGNKAIRKMDPVTYALSTVVGGPEAGVFDNPYGCAWDSSAGVLYVSDQATPPATPDGIGNVIYMVQ